MADRLTGIEVFVLAMRLGSLSAAGRSLGMSAAMAAKHLGQLEERLGTTLVNRTTRRLSLTQAGADYLDRAERILAELREAENEASARSQVIEGLLRVNAPASFGVMHISSLAAEFGVRHPGVTIELGLNDRYVDLLEERWDVAIRIGQLADSSLKARKLAAVHLALCAAPSYLEQHGTPRSVEDLKHHNCLSYTLSSRLGGNTWGFGRDGSVRVAIKGSMLANNGEALVKAACTGQGIVYGPRFIAAEALNSGELVEFELDIPAMDMGAVYAVTHPTRRPNARTSAWIDFLAERMPRLAEEW
ncbi:transcriptional regulator [Novosphingobium nitrogenifigens DSM 19370]|uniref:Transcriptional regulator n=1 Tax=Novosphingobium nitrogenifigens DSM 19370 TaxID=983920 RepID=F1ZB67_9SPHN|nr:LysR family transcriptional regulator [Novosphingobium nitrogenifigens]EGD58066.1 transcriptional regulator [Novosphingobium nitrogenifigens DSM 19370]